VEIVNDLWFVAVVMFSSWMGATIMYILFGYPLKMMVREEELRLSKRGGGR
jgi:hypothetical protein